MNLSELFILNIKLSEFPNLILEYFSINFSLILIITLFFLGRILFGKIYYLKKIIASFVLVLFILTGIFFTFFFIQNDSKIFLVNTSALNVIHTRIYFSLLIFYVVFWVTFINSIFLKDIYNIPSTLFKSLRNAVLCTSVPILLYGYIDIYIGFLFGNLQQILPTYLGWIPLVLTTLPIIAIFWALNYIFTTLNLSIAYNIPDPILEKSIDITKLKAGDFEVILTLIPSRKLQKLLNKIYSSDSLDDTGDDIKDEIVNLKNILEDPILESSNNKIDSLFGGKNFELNLNDSTYQFEINKLLKQKNGSNTFTLGKFTKLNDENILKVKIQNIDEYFIYSLRLTKKIFT